MIWLWLGLAALLLVAAVVCAAAVIVGAQSEERRGVLRFDTPAARSALRRCNPARDVHYFGGQARCECGEVTYAEVSS